MRLRFPLASLVLALLAAPASAQITYDGQITEPDWYLIDTDDGGPVPGFGSNYQINALYADIADDSSSISLGIAGIVDRDAGNHIVVLLDTRAGGYTDGSFGRANAPSGGNGIGNFNSGTTFDDGFAPDYALQITCATGPDQCFFDLFTLSGSSSNPSDGGPNNFLGTETDPDLGSFLDFGDTNTRTRGYEVRLTASNGSGTSSVASTDIVLDRSSFQAFAFLTSATGFLSNQFLTPAGSGDGNYGSGAVTFGAASPDPVVYAEQVFADDKTAPFKDKGFRQLAAPARDLTVQWLADQDIVAFDGTPNGGPPRFVVDDYDTGAGGFIEASAFTDPLVPGNGFLWFLSDGRRGSQALSWVFEGGGPMATGTTSRTHGVNTDDFYLVGNPFVDGLQLSGVTSSVGTIADAVYVFDPGSGSYTTLSRSSGDVLAPMQGAFFEIAETPSSPSVTWEIPQTARATGGTFVSKDAAPRATLVLERETENGWERAETLALVAASNLDTRKPLTAPDGSPLATRLTAATASRAGLGQVGLADAGRVALDLRAEPGTYRWRLDGDLAVTLRDAATGTETDLGSAHAFTASGDLAGRFSLALTEAAGETEAIRRVGDVVPNPTAGQARIFVDAAEPVRVEIRDVLGRLVAVPFEGEPVGPQALALNTDGLAPGAYLVRVVGQTFAETRRLTVAR